MKTFRKERIEKQIQKLAAQVFASFDDPRFSSLSVVDVRVSPDLKYADIYVSVLDDSIDKENLNKALKNAEKRVRYLIAQEIKLRYMPIIRLKLDDSIKKGVRIEQILNELFPENNKEENDE